MDVEQIDPMVLKINQIFFDKINDCLNKGDNQGAIALAEKNCDKLKKIFGENHPNYARVLENAGHTFVYSGDLEKAIPYYQKAIEIFRKTNNKSQELARSLNNLGGLYLSLHQLEKAQKYIGEGWGIRKELLGEDHPELLDSLNNLAGIFVYQGKYEEALPIFQKIIDIYQENFSEMQPAFATSLNNLGTTLTHLGRYREAEEIFRNAMEIQRKILGEHHADYQRTVNNLEALYRLTGKEKQIESQRIVDFENIRKKQGDLDPLYGKTLIDFARRKEDEGDYILAESLYQKSLVIFRENFGEKNPLYLNTLYHLAYIHKLLGKFESALSFYKNLIPLVEDVHGKLSKEYSDAMNDLGLLHKELGNFTEAEKYYVESLDIKVQLFGEDSIPTAVTMNNLGYLYMCLGNLPKASQLYQKVIEIKKKQLGEENLSYATSLTNFAYLHELLGDIKEAKTLYERSLWITEKKLGKDHPFVASNLTNLALLNEQEGNFALAELFLKKSLIIRGKQLGESSPEFNASLNNLGTFYINFKKYAEAESILRQAIKGIEKNFGKNHILYARTISNLGAVYYSQGDFIAAEPLAKESKIVTGESLGKNHPEYAQVLRNLAGIYIMADKKEDALLLFKEAITIEDKVISTILPICSENQRLTFISSIRYQFDVYISFILQYFAHDSDRVKDSFDFVLRRKAITGEVFMAQKDASLIGKFPEYKNAVDEINELRRTISNLTLSGPNEEGIEKHKEKLVKLYRQKDGLEADLAKKIPEFNLEQQLKNVTRDIISKKIPPDSVLIEFVRYTKFNFAAIDAKHESRIYEDRYCAFLMKCQDPDAIQIVDLGDATIIDTLIGKFKYELLGGVTQQERDLGEHFRELPLAQIENTGHKLFDTVVRPLMSIIDQGNHLIIAPDSELSAIPFEIIPIGSNNRLIDLFSITYIGVGRDILRFSTIVQKTSSLPVVIADPAYDLTMDGSTSIETTVSESQLSRDFDMKKRFTYLPATKIEGEKIATMLGVKPWLGSEALEGKLKRVQSPNIIHIATHGFFLKNKSINEGKYSTHHISTEGLNSMKFNSSAIAIYENPLLRSGLALAGVNTWLNNGKLPPEAEDGILTAEDVTGLDLTSTDLVVLSACETGLGEVQVGEGVLGLRRSFMLAGAKSLIISLWSVPDSPTQELMEMLYKHMLRGKSRAESLRAAQLTLRERYPHPRDWGAFIFQGADGIFSFDR